MKQNKEKKSLRKCSLHSCTILECKSPDIFGLHTSLDEIALAFELSLKIANLAGVIASFSRALTEGLSAKQTESQFNGALDAAIQSIFEASNK